MANVTVKDAAAATKYLKSTGVGSDPDPFIPAHAIDSFPAAQLGQKAMAASLSVVMCNNLTAGTYVGDHKLSGLSQTLVRTYTTSADMTTAAAISAAPTAGQKLVLVAAVVSSQVDQLPFTIQEETSATEFMAFDVPAKGAVVLPMFQGWLKTAVADKKFFGKASAAGNVYVTLVYYSEA